MQDFILSFMNQFGYFGILLLIAVENIFPPIPSEVILTFGGFMTTYTDMNVVLVIVFATIGSVIGAIVLYGLGRFLKQERLKRMVDSKIGKFLRFKKEDIEKADVWFRKKGSYTVFFCRFIPIVRSLISIPAGISKMSFWKFCLLTTAGTAIWNSVLVILGSLMGSNWEVIASFVDRYAQIVLFLFVVLIFIGVVIFYKKRIGKKRK